MIAPFVLLAAGAVVALIGKAAGVEMDENIVTHGQVRSAVEQAVRRKRLASWVAVGLAGIGVIFAGWVVFTTYSKSTRAVTPASEIVFSPAGQSQFTAACGAPARQVLGSVTLAGQWVTIKLDSRTICSTGLDTLTVPSASIKYIHNTR